MKRTRFAAFITAAAAALTLGMTMTAFADTKDPVDPPLAISIGYELSNGMTKSDIDVDCQDDGVSTVTVSSITNTAYGKRPTVTLKVKVESGYMFTTDYDWTSSSAYDFDNDDITFSSAKRNSSSSLTIKIRLPKIGGSSDDTLDIEEVHWEDEEGYVEWSSAADADKYEVKLMRGSSTKEVITTTNTHYDFKSAIRSNGEGTYTVRVRSVVGTYKGTWTESDEFEVDEDVLDDMGGKRGSSSSGSSSYSYGGPATGTSGTSGTSSQFSSGGAWLRDSVGIWYCNADRTYTTNNWQQIDGYWYWFNESGYMLTGWLQSPFSGKWYYLSTDNATLGRMLTNTYIGNYYVGADGAWVQ